MAKPWTFERTWADTNVKNGWSATVYEYGYSCTIQCRRRGERDEWTLSVQPEEFCAYSLLVDVAMFVGAFHFKAFSDLWETSSVVFQQEIQVSSVVDVTLRIRIIETLSPQDLSTATPYRDFELTCDGRVWFLDVVYLSSLGGRVFTAWNDLRNKGIKQYEADDVSCNELECIIDATAKYRQIIISRTNYDVLASVCFRYSIAVPLRAVESFLMDAEWIHPIRRLEYAVCYKLARLGDMISRDLNNSGRAIEILHEHLEENNENLEQAHPDVLVSLNIFPDFILM